MSSSSSSSSKVPPEPGEATTSNDGASKRKLCSSSEWTWEDEMLMYDLTNRGTSGSAKPKNKREKRGPATETIGSNEDGLVKAEIEAERRDMREERKLFVRGLTPATVEKDLWRHFEQFGQVVESRIMRDRENGGSSRGFGFITFACSFMAEAALERPEDHVIDGNAVEVRRAKYLAAKTSKTVPEAQPELHDEPHRPPGQIDWEAKLDSECQNKRSIFVGALNDSIAEEDLVSYFSTFGKVLRAVKVQDKLAGGKKTFGFVDFADQGVVRKVMGVTRHFLQGKRMRVELSRPRIQFSHQTKTVYVGGLQDDDGIEDIDLHRYFSEFGFVSRAIRVPNGRELPKRKFGFVDFDDYDAVDIVVSQRWGHCINGHPVSVELALPLINDSLYEKDVLMMTGETWMEKVQRKLQFAIPDQGSWGQPMNAYEVFVRSDLQVQTIRFKIPRGLLEYVVGMAGKVVEGIANDTSTHIVLSKPDLGAKHVVFSVTGKKPDVHQAQYIFQQIVKSNLHKLNQSRPITNS